MKFNSLKSKTHNNIIITIDCFLLIVINIILFILINCYTNKSFNNLFIYLQSSVTDSSPRTRIREFLSFCCQQTGKTIRDQMSWLFKIWGRPCIWHPKVRCMNGKAQTRKLSNCFILLLENDFVDWNSFKSGWIKVQDVERSVIIQQSESIFDYFTDI